MSTSILVVGATGATGIEIVKQGLARGYTITAAVRRPEAAALPTGARVVRGDVMDPASLRSAMAGQQAVLCSLGSKLSRKPTTMLSDGTRNLLTAMQEAAVQRLLCITGVGAGDSRGHGGFLYDKIIQPLLLNEVYKDKDRQEQVVRSSKAEWTLVRPGQLTNGPLTSSYRALTDLTGITMGKISRADVAEFLWNALEDPGSVSKTYNLTY